MLRKALRLPAVKAATAKSRSEIYEDMTLGLFPRNFPTSEDGRAVAWWEDEIIAYQEARDAVRDAKRAEWEAKRKKQEQRIAERREKRIAERDKAV